MNTKCSPEEHMLDRANYFKGLVTKTTDPVEWEKEKLLEAKEALHAAQHHRAFENALAMIESAVHKASFG